MKITQYCSVCREELEMEVVPTEDDEEDGVIWLRCPGCRGFLPKIGAAFAEDPGRRAGAEAAAAPDASAEGEDGDAAAGSWGSPAADGPATAPVEDIGEEEEEEEGEARPEPARPARGAAKAPAPPAEPLDEYAALLADADLESARPYRPWNTYEVGDVVHHLAWADHGIVVAKETLPGGRKAVKVYFDQAGVVRLIESADVEP